MKIKYTFVILHYLALDMTKECVETLISTFGNVQNFKIVIVDNASPNGSGKSLQELYSNNQFVDVLLNNENSGFARGNNLGYVHAKENYDPEYIIILNNDVLIKDIKFLEKVESIYQEYNYAVLGPDIFASKINLHQSPTRVKGVAYDELNKMIHNAKKALKVYPINFIWRKVKHFAKCLKRENKAKFNDFYKEKIIKNPVLHGACYIFSRLFIINEEVAFYPETFMYLEEDILHYYCLKKSYLMLYCSDLQVEHLDDVSTDMVFSSYYKKSKMKMKNMLDSEMILLKMMEQDGDMI